jgi:NADPH-dependent glutamate synthase beta subunit-like oxidoreductase
MTTYLFTCLQIPKERNGKSVAVVGSGPAGLACAHQLNKVSNEEIR